MQEVCGRNAHASNGEPQLAKRSPLGEDLRVKSVQTANVRERRAWAAGIVFVLALVAETAISAGLPINQGDSAAKIAGAFMTTGMPCSSPRTCRSSTPSPS